MVREQEKSDDVGPQHRHQYGGAAEQRGTDARQAEHTSVVAVFPAKLVFEEVMTDDSFYFGDGTPVFLEESSVNGETIKFGRFDIVLSPE